MSLRVAYIVKMYPRLSETFIVNEILGLEAQGVQVDIYSLHAPRDGRFHERLGRVRGSVTYLPPMSAAQVLESVAEHAPQLAPHREFLGRQTWAALESGDPRRLRTLGRGIQLGMQLNARPVDHIHAHFATSAAECAETASVIAGVPFSFTAHAKDIYLDDYVGPDLAARMTAARFCVTVCDANARYLRGIAPDARVERVYNGLDLSEFTPLPDDRRDPATIVSVGRLVAKKGLDTLLDACAELHRQGVPFRCDLAGTGPEEPALREQAERLGLEDTVRFLGAVSNEEARRLIGQATVFALPARITGDGNRDALPTVLLEALASGTPVVSTPVTGIPEIVGPDEAGRIVPADDAPALVRALAALLADPAARRAHGAAGRQRAEARFDGRRSAAELLRLFESGSRSPEEEPGHAAALR